MLEARAIEHPKVKFWTHKSIASAKPKRKGVEKRCIQCYRLYKDNIDPNSLGVICPICLMGLAEGAEKPPKSKPRRILFRKPEKSGKKWQ